jgi:hypothetical protein
MSDLPKTFRATTRDGVTFESGVRAREPILEERSGYGSPEVNLGLTAALWSSFLNGRADAMGVPFNNFELRASDVCLMMDLLKTARATTGKYNPDNAVDKKGYTELYDMLAKEGK